MYDDELTMKKCFISYITTPPHSKEQTCEYLTYIIFGIQNANKPETRMGK
jgi:hypothetical protein